jgi:Rps23 Pro-64 3,4-dihydroxylase Tpa1-like proline 4-hydroxylase
MEAARVSDESAPNAVTLVLSGGHLLRLAGDVDVHALVQHLQSSESQSGVVEIESSGNERLILRRGALLGLVTSRDGADVPALAQPSSIPFHRIENFLSAEEHQSVLERVLSRESEFVASAVTTGDKSVRKSIVLTADEMITPMFRTKIMKILPELAGLSDLKFAQTTRPDDIECQITAHLDGGFFQIHNDSGSEETRSRVITFVYYFESRPNSFLGGELRIYEPELHGKDGRTRYTIVPPTDNSLVFFPSGVMHEVLPTYVQSKIFADSRFTINGWIRRG